MNEDMLATGTYHTECRNALGELLWTDESKNLITIQGKNSLLDQGFAGSAYTAAWVMSLTTAGTITTAATYAVPVVTEIAAGIITSNARPSTAWSASSAGTKSATTTTFSITGSATITGNMLLSGGTGVATVANTTATGGVLFSSALFTAGSKVVASGDSLAVSYSITV